MKKPANTPHNQKVVSILKTVKETSWAGTITFHRLDECATSMNFNAPNRGSYTPSFVRFPGVIGMFLINEDGSIYWEGRVIKLDEEKYLIEYLTNKAYNEFESKDISH